MPHKLTISIVNFNTGGYLLNCLRSLEKVKDETKLVIYVVDNASVDGSIEKAQKEFKKVNFILNKENLGFGRAHNQVLSKATSEYILILNPDTEIKSGVLSYMLNFMDKNSDVAASTCEVILPNGQIDLTAHRGFPTPWASFLYFLGDDSKYHLSNKDLAKAHEVDAISGSFFLIRKSVLDKVGLFDEDYFMYAEDIDLCFRIKKAGFKIMYLPQVSMLHHKGVSSGLKKHTQTITTADIETRKRSLNAFYQTMKIFYSKHYAKHNLFIVNWLVYLGIDLKWWFAKRKMVV